MWTHSCVLRDFCQCGTSAEAFFITWPRVDNLFSVPTEQMWEKVTIYIYTTPSPTGTKKMTHLPVFTDVSATVQSCSSCNRKCLADKFYTSSQTTIFQLIDVEDLWRASLSSIDDDERGNASVLCTICSWRGSSTKPLSFLRHTAPLN